MSQTEQPLVDIVVPVYNEERVLSESVRRLRTYLDRSFPFSTVITIADNASTDRTSSIATTLSGELEGVRTIRLEEKGRGRALRAAWTASDAHVVAYMDVDLSSSLNALLPLVAPLMSDHSVISIGSRLAHGANIVRSRKRDLISRAYNRLLRITLRSEFSDAQCGFKAVSAEVARRLLPEVQDDDWFFDTELLFRAQRHGLRINEVPVDWVEDPDSRVDIVPTVIEDLRGIARLLRDVLSRTSPSRAPLVAASPPPIVSAAPAPLVAVSAATAPGAPLTEAPLTEAPLTEAPLTEAPLTEAPLTEAPLTPLPCAETVVSDFSEVRAP